MHALLLTLGLLLAPARAQAPALSLMPTAAPAADSVVLTQDATLKRWSQGEAVVAELTAGTPVVVILEDGDMVRVRKDLDFGWIPAAALASADDAAPEDAAAE